MKCRHCAAELSLTLVDLGSAPPSNSYLNEATLHKTEKCFPLRVLVCQKCWLVQTEDFAHAHELFDDEYAYFSGFSTSWLVHAECYVNKMVAMLNLGSNSHVMEIAANDGYLLQYVQALGIPCTGIEPTASTASVARSKGVNIVEDFFGIQLARNLLKQIGQADLMIANNVLAHVPDINDFVAGSTYLLKDDGVATFEFPHLINLISGKQFDTIYHEHFSYLSLTVVRRIFEASGLNIFRVEELPTHGGSLRVYAQKGCKYSMEKSVTDIISREMQAGIQRSEYYRDFQVSVDRVRYELLNFLNNAQRNGKTVAAYGAAAKGNTLLNYANVNKGLVSFVVDRNPAKHGKWMPGSRIPIVNEEYLKQAKPDYILILPWNLRSEISEQLNYVKKWGGMLFTVIPVIQVE